MCIRDSPYPFAPSILSFCILHWLVSRPFLTVQRAQAVTFMSYHSLCAYSSLFCYLFTYLLLHASSICVYFTVFIIKSRFHLSQRTQENRVRNKRNGRSWCKRCDSQNARTKAVSIFALRRLRFCVRWVAYVACDVCCIGWNLGLKLSSISNVYLYRHIVTVMFIHCVPKNIPDIFDCSVKTNYQILITFGTKIPDTTCHQTAT